MGDAYSEGLSGIRAVFSGVDDLAAGVTAMNARVDLATLAALKAVQNKAKVNIRSRLRGRPRWNHRGASARTGPAVRLQGAANGVTRAGGPGKFTGTLSKGVGGVKTPKMVAGEYAGGVGVGGGVRNLYKARNEAKFPYFKPAIDKTTAQTEVLWAAAWGKALDG